MLAILYNVFIYLLALVYRLGSLFIPKAKLRVRGQDNWLEIASRRDSSKPLAWFHCASLGEFEQGRPVIEAFKMQYPSYQILLTFFSPSGYEVRKNYKEADMICYLPLDTPSNVNAFLDNFQPSIAFFVKYEFWRNFILGLQQRSVSVISFSTIFRSSQVYFKPWGRFSRETLLAFDHIFVQNEESETLLQSINYANITVAGDTRFDRVADTLKNIKEIEIAAAFSHNAKVMVCGSVWAEDMDVLVPFMNQSKGLKFIIAPHEIDEKQISGWQNKLTARSEKYSILNQKEKQDTAAQILFIDNIGMLSSLYQYADFAFIGGSFGKGLHNTLEAATFGMPIFFGDKAYHKFQEAMDLKEAKAAFSVGDFDELNKLVSGFLEGENNYIKSSNAASDYVKNHTGASQKVMDWVKGFL